MKYGIFGFLAALACVAFIAAPASADEPTPPTMEELAARDATSLNECKEELRSTAAALEGKEEERAAAQKALDECLEGKSGDQKGLAATPPNGGKEFKQGEVVECTNGAFMTPSGSCDCEEGWFPTLVTGRFVRTTKVVIGCSITKAQYDADLAGINARLNIICDGSTTDACAEARRQYLEASGSEPDGATIQNFKLLIEGLQTQIDENRKGIAANKKKLDEEACLKDGTNCPKFAPSEKDGFVASPNEFGVGAAALAIIHPGGPPDTFGAGVYFSWIGWFAARQAIQATGYGAYGANSNGARGVAGADIRLAHALTEDRHHRVEGGAVALFEPGRPGNLGTFIAPCLGYRYVNGVSAGITGCVGGAMTPMFTEDGQITDELSPVHVAGSVIGTIGVGLGGAAPPATTSSSTTTGGSASVSTPGS